MKPYIVTTFFTLFFVFTLQAQVPSEYPVHHSSVTNIPTYTDQELKERLSKIQSRVVPPQLTSVVKSYINTYTVKKRDKTERMLGKMNVYFPMFEKYMMERNVPVDLKYLSIVESALNPTAVSRSGAVGLWQFMPATGKEYGLKANSLVDERKDPNKSTRAAITYLKRLYNKYQDWSLALAAYNGGPGRVNRAIKRGRSKNFWRIRRYLPRETRAYVPAFIAATYIANYYHDHNLVPLYPSLDMQLTASSKVYQRISFQKVSDITGVSMDLIKRLNPSYKQRFFPTNRRGNYIVLPQKGMSVLLNYLGRPDEKLNHMVAQSIAGPSSMEFNPDFVRVNHIVRAGDSLEGLSRKYQCTVQTIMEWNRLPTSNVRPEQELVIYRPKNMSSKWKDMPSLPTLLRPVQINNLRDLEEELPMSKADLLMSIRKYGYSQLTRSGKYYYYQIRRRESLADIADKFADVTIEDLMKLNKIKSSHQLKPGKKIIIRKWK